MVPSKLVACLPDYRDPEAGGAIARNGRGEFDADQLSALQGLEIKGRVRQSTPWSGRDERWSRQWIGTELDPRQIGGGRHVRVLCSHFDGSDCGPHHLGGHDARRSEILDLVLRLDSPQRLDQPRTVDYSDARGTGDSMDQSRRK